MSKRETTRNMEICRLFRQEGVSVKSLRIRFNLTHQRIYAILRKGGKHVPLVPSSGPLPGPISRKSPSKPAPGKKSVPYAGAYCVPDIGPGPGELQKVPGPSRSGRSASDCSDEARLELAL